jgi:hypothetical protein
MNHKNTTLAIAAIVAAVAVTAIGFAVPQQALAYRHHHSNVIKVDQQISQANLCAGVNEEAGENPTLAERESAEPAPAPTICLNNADNTADIHR